MSNKIQYVCTECDWSGHQWLGRCPGCQSWGTVEESQPVASPVVGATARVITPPQPLTAVVPPSSSYHSTGMGEFDRVLGKGIVRGSVMLLAGEPGVGKSTLLLEVAARSAATGLQVLYVSAEESAGQVLLRAQRIGAVHERVHLATETQLAIILHHIAEIKPDLMIIDSVQTVSPGNGAGSVSDVKHVASQLIHAAKTYDIATLLVGHVTKDGQVAGPKVLEHLVDVVCHFEGDKNNELRLIRSLKNRYGPTDEIGCFLMQESGLVEVPDPSGLFISDRAEPATSGTCTTITLEGKRAIPVEIQGLVAGSMLANPRRATSGLDAKRLAMTLAVLQRRAYLPFGDQDVYAATTGGAKVSETGADLAVSLALVSSLHDRPLPQGFAAIGEISLTGQVRRVTRMSSRISEAYRLGFTQLMVPSGHDATKIPRGLQLIEVKDINDALAKLFSESRV